MKYHAISRGPGQPTCPRCHQPELTSRAEDGAGDRRPWRGSPDYPWRNTYSFIGAGSSSRARCFGFQRPEPA